MQNFSKCGLRPPALEVLEFLLNLLNWTFMGCPQYMCIKNIHPNDFMHIRVQRPLKIWISYALKLISFFHIFCKWLNHINFYFQRSFIHSAARMSWVTNMCCTEFSPFLSFIFISVNEMIIKINWITSVPQFIFSLHLFAHSSIE